ncbi:MAG TPA: hypothetical protein VFL76_05650 [Edaphocola sp.]|nr:hypothetical protein [Edaphocola sp.]
MYKNKVNNISTIFILFLFSSCNSIVGAMYGERDVSKLDKKMVVGIISRDDVLKQQENYYLDSNFVDFCYSHFPENHKILHDFLQPMQALYFDSSGRLISWHLNCYAGGFPNLKWNRGDVFATFPPKSQRPVTDSVSLAVILPYLKKFDSLNLNYSKPGQSSPLTIVVFWNYQMFKQSKRLIDLVEQNLKLNADKRQPRMIFVNTDLMYVNWENERPL